MRRCLLAVPLFAALVLSAGLVRADAPYDGTWKVVIVGAQELTLFLIKVEDGPKLALLGAGVPSFKDAKLTPEKATGDEWRFKAAANGITLDFVAHPPKGEKAPKEMRGSVEVRGSREMVRYERSDAKELDQKSAFKAAEGLQEYAKTMRQRPKEKIDALKELIEKHPTSPLVYQANVDLVGALAATGGKEGALRDAAEKAIELASAYGPEMKSLTLSKVAQKITSGKKAPELALDYARRAEKALSADAATTQQVQTLKTLVSALTQAGKKDELSGASERLAKLEKVLDEEFLRDAVPFKTESFKRGDKTGRVVLVELFTGAQCPPCVAADVAFDAALKTFASSDVVALQYHLHIPGPDPLTNKDTEQRSEYYKVRGVPSIYVDGGDDLGIGGPKQMGKSAFGQLSAAIEKDLDKKTSAKLKLAAKQVGDDIVITAEVSNVKHAKDETKLRFALVEESVRYPGNNGQRFHHHVVRAMPGGADGFAVKGPDAKQEVKVNLTTLRKALTEYLEEANERRPFLDDDRPLDLAHLFVVAFVQDDDTKEILQADRVDLHGEKK